MAFSMFLRNTVCSSQVLSQQMSKLVTPGMFACRMMATRPLASMLPVSNVNLKEIKSAPMMTVVRPFRTSAVRMSDEEPHDHAKMWVIERSVTASLVFLIPLGLAFPNKIVDLALALLISAHVHWGMEAIAVDYVRASIFGPFIPKLAIGLVYLLSIVTLGGLFYLISHDVGLCEAVKQLWAIKSQQNS